MFKNLFNILATVTAVIPLCKDLWFAVKKDVPRVTCPNCKGAGSVIIGGEILSNPASTVSCPICKGSGKIKQTEIPKGGI